uniref:SOCS box domain-containing protein n=1 Tax=Ciona savignyi TaxID=51511 RepID=H2YZ12_CIOSA
PLHAAVRKGHDYCLEALLKAFPDLVNSTNMNGETPLYLAAIHSKLRAAKRLLQYQADPNIGRNSLETPLVAAVDNDHREMALCLINGGANVNKSLNRGWTALHEAVYRNHSQVLELLLAKGGTPNIRDGFGISPVFTSAACGRNQCLEMLLRAGGDPNLPALSKSAPPLYEACKEGHLDCVITLLSNGADPHLVNCDGLLPIHVASYRGCIEIVERLLPVTDRKMAQECGMSPIHSATKGDHIEILEMLIQHGYDVNVKLTRDKMTYRDRRQTALFAVYNDSEEATRMLLEAGAETELDYVKPLLVAVSHSQYDMADLLMTYGADVNASFNEEGGTFPATVAFGLRDYRMLKQILVSGCDVTKCLSCHMGDRRHSEFSETERKRSVSGINRYFCHYLTEPHNITWCGDAVRYLLQFTGCVRLCSRVVEAVHASEEWEDIQRLAGSPRSLLHLSRLKIRQQLGTRGVREKMTYESLPLPRPLRHYLMYCE